MKKLSKNARHAKMSGTSVIGVLWTLEKVKQSARQTPSPNFTTSIQLLRLVAIRNAERNF